MKNYIKKIFEKSNQENQEPVPIKKGKKKIDLNFVQADDLSKWLKDLELIKIGNTAYFLGYNQELKISTVIGYSFKLLSDFESKVTEPYFELIYILCEDSGTWLHTIKEVSSEKAFPTRELLLMNIQADILLKD